MMGPVQASELLNGLREKEVWGETAISIRGIAYDSRKVQPGFLFVAIRGLHADGRQFIPQAVERGAVAVVAEGVDPLPGGRVLRVLVPESRVALARLSAAFHGEPSRRLCLVGITGTNGKTTTSYLTEALLREMGHGTGLIGTVVYRIGDVARQARQTTPEALELQGLLAEMVAAGVGGVAMEVSSHALAQGRVEACAFDVTCFTNLTQDHLDFHRSFEEYRRAKAHLFELLDSGGKPNPRAVLNADDPASGAMAAATRAPVLTYGIRGNAHVRAESYTSDLGGIRLRARTPSGPVAVGSPLIGEHNVYNLLAAAGVGVALGLPVGRITRALGSVSAVPGRFQPIDAGQDFLVVVDYAHTPDALERVLETARKITPGRLACVFGCGGDRDRGKRPLMGALAGRLADFTVVTSDNPRSEDPLAIIQEIVAGLKPVCRDAEAHVIVPERSDAIRRAIEWARPGDTILIAGKGHETYQIIGSESFPFDDQEVAWRHLRARCEKVT